ncbi:MAG: hypothetical protein JJU13_14200 [Balneolaceae bacterium]|nr:hypothetical protein [Balneolaceae bacterium]
MKIADRIKRLEQQKQPEEWPGSITIFYDGDEALVIERTMHNGRVELTERVIPASEAKKIDHPNMLIITNEPE